MDINRLKELQGFVHGWPEKIIDKTTAEAQLEIAIQLTTLNATMDRIAGALERAYPKPSTKEELEKELSSIKFLNPDQPQPELKVGEIHDCPIVGRVIIDIAGTLIDIPDEVHTAHLTNPGMPSEKPFTDKETKELIALLREEHFVIPAVIDRLEKHLDRLTAAITNPGECENCKRLQDLVNAKDELDRVRCELIDKVGKDNKRLGEALGQTQELLQDFLDAYFTDKIIVTVPEVDGKRYQFGGWRHQVVIVLDKLKANAALENSEIKI
jgi:hypothetical protein